MAHWVLNLQHSLHIFRTWQLTISQYSLKNAIFIAWNEKKKTLLAFVHYLFRQVNISSPLKWWPLFWLTNNATLPINLINVGGSKLVFGKVGRMKVRGIWSLRVPVFIFYLFFFFFLLFRCGEIIIRKMKEKEFRCSFASSYSGYFPISVANRWNVNRR